MSELEKAYLKFAAYGNTSTMNNDMTGKNFSKMCLECGVMDGKTVNCDDVDIAFNKVKAKGACTINYIEFLRAMKILCVKRFSRKLPEDALQATFKLLEGKEPADVEAINFVMANGMERKTDTSNNLGSPKQRFDKNEKGSRTVGHVNLAQDISNAGNSKGSAT